MQSWDTADESQLKTMLAHGIPYEAIARRLGRSRNAICSKVYCMGLAKGRPRKGRPAGRPVLLPGGRIKAPIVDDSISGAVLQRHDAEARARAGSLVSLEDRCGCCFPVGDPGARLDVYCNHPTNGVTDYCSEHYSRIYNPPFVARQLEPVAIKIPEFANA